MTACSELLPAEIINVTWICSLLLFLFRAGEARGEKITISDNGIMNAEVNEV
jgi:hypothetical protein